jgi:L-threonylcarbamoyladenylate synthase
MNTIVKNPTPEALTLAADLLHQGKLVAFPTETVYGLGADALNSQAVAGIFAAKGRPANNPVIVHIAEANQLPPLVQEIPEIAKGLIAHFWPGPLTLIFPAAKIIPAQVTAGGPTVAIRVPAHPVAAALLKIFGKPIAGPSANRSMQLSPTTAEHVVRDMTGRIDLILDGGPTSGGIESTVLDVTSVPPRLLRPGLVDVPTLEALIGPVELGFLSESSTTLPSPGLLRKHYCPRTPLEVCHDPAARAAQLGERVGIVVREPIDCPGAAVVILPTDAAGYAARIYAVLHELDTMGLARILVQAVPADETWRGIRDRLRRAAETNS